MNQTVNQSVDQRMNQSVDQSMNQSVDQTVNQSVDQTVNQSVDQRMNQSVDQTVNQSVDQRMNQSVNINLSGPIIQEHSHESKPQRTHTGLLKTSADHSKFEYYLTMDLVLYDFSSDTARTLDVLPMRYIDIFDKYMICSAYNKPYSSIVNNHYFSTSFYLCELTKLIESEHTHKLFTQNELIHTRPIIDNVKPKIDSTMCGPRDIIIISFSDEVYYILWIESLDTKEFSDRLFFRQLTDFNPLNVLGEDSQLRQENELNKKTSILSNFIDSTLANFFIDFNMRIKTINKDLSNNLWILTGLSKNDQRELYKVSFNMSTHTHTYKNIFQLKNDQLCLKNLQSIFKYNAKDLKHHPGSLLTVHNQSTKKSYIYERDNCILMYDTNYEKNSSPYIYLYNYLTKEKRIIWDSHSEHTHSELVALRMDTMNSGVICMNIASESSNRSAKYYTLNLSLNDYSVSAPQLYFDNSFSYNSIQGFQKKAIKYLRSDGINLSATLYLPFDYNPNKYYPILITAYPLRYTSKDYTGTEKSSTNEMTYITGCSPLYFLAKNYIVVDDCDMPIVKGYMNVPNEKTPDDVSHNNTFIEQLILNSEAIINYLKTNGLSDGKNIAIMGHSYGAFMTMNLLIHTNLFTTGIARSGAYNRTLTPFGFQDEDRFLWDSEETKEIYFKLSPLLHAEKIKVPVLLIHGIEDKNPGTYPMQSERMYEALRGLGKPARMVLLPHEDHSYIYKESILHVLAEIENWLEKMFVQ
jgi:dienelactone hydrolase